MLYCSFSSCSINICLDLFSKCLSAAVIQLTIDNHSFDIRDVTTSGIMINRGRIPDGYYYHLKL